MSKNILVVEDEANIVEILKIRLESAGYQVDSAMDGEEGLTKAKSGKFDLILLDLSLPKRDGQSICMELKMDPKIEKTPIVMLTSRTEVQEKEIANKMGANAYLTKPFETEDLLNTVKQLLP